MVKFVFIILTQASILEGAQKIPLVDRDVSAILEKYPEEDNHSCGRFDYWLYTSSLMIV